ncbi:MAG: formylglycine-generating enzyme family protein [Deltaproteobacteria bacterium]|jgi:formylglycine-generating enzyme required for sulfatase activity|nr:formylglycine-generating enzyme family protein [Deltaproteobacteria bacterium]
MIAPVIRFAALSALVIFGALSSSARANEAINSIGMEFVLIPAGSFLMGAVDEGEKLDQFPRHKVTITKPFYLGKYPVTQYEWESVMDNNPSARAGSDLPVEMVSWANAREFIAKLNRKENTKRYRLPSEAEWEYSARAGATTAYFFGDDKGDLERYSWNSDNSGGHTHPVGEKEPNPWGLYDIFGNVWEWTNDWYGGDYYANSPSSDPPGPSDGTARVNRGCSFHYVNICLTSYRGVDSGADYLDNDIGFRLAYTVETARLSGADNADRKTRNPNK